MWEEEARRAGSHRQRGKKCEKQEKEEKSGQKNHACVRRGNGRVTTVQKSMNVQGNRQLELVDYGPIDWSSLSSVHCHGIAVEAGGETEERNGGRQRGKEPE